MRRPFWAYLLVFGLLATLSAFSWLTHHPEAEILRQAEEWPLLGPLAASFRRAYLRGESRGADGAENAAEGMDERPRDGGTGTSFQPPVFERHVWVLPGMELKQAASAQSRTVYRFETIAKVGKFENRGDWYRVYHNGWKGWVLLEGYDETAEIPYPESPEPPRPVTARAPEEEWLAAARQYLRGNERVARLGAYTLFTDVPDDSLIAFLDVVAGRLESVYAERYGRRPIGVPAEGIVLYRSDIAYRLLQQRSERIAGLTAAGHNAKGLAVLYSGGRSRSDVAGTVIHELVHFINRRALGPQLPPWLDEGLADNLALSRIDEDGRIHPREIGGARLKRGEEVRIEGGHASLWHLREALKGGTLPAVPELMSTDWEDFVRPPEAQLHYAAAAFWIRYLLDGEGGRHAAAFRAFLDDVAAGEPPTAETLGARLGEDWSVLGARFRAWIEHRAASAGLPDDIG